MQRAERLAELLFSRQHALRHLNAFINTPTKTSIESFLNSPLGNRPQLEQTLVAIKDNICTKDLPTTCASKGLEDYTSPYDASVVDRLRRAGALIAGKTNCDEFGMGSHSLNSAFGPVKTESGHSAGGSSGGSAVAVATGQCASAVGTDTGGSVRLPAAYTGIYGFKPSYGLVSRWGVVAYANSLDTVGFFARHPMSIKVLMDVTNAPDSRDPTNLDMNSRKRLKQALNERPLNRKLRIGIPEEYNTMDIDSNVRQAWKDTARALEEAGHSIHPVTLPSTRSALSAYYVLAPAEASSNLAKYDGVRYGSQAPGNAASKGLLYANTRQHGFGSEVRRRILLGAYSLSAAAIDNYFIQAQKVRRQVKDEFDAVFALPNPLKDSDGDYENEEGVDAILCPTAPTLPPTLDAAAKQTPLEAYAGDVFTVPASLAGLPAISVPIRIMTEHRIDSVGMQIITQYGDDDRAIFIADLLDDLGLCKRFESVSAG